MSQQVYYDVHTEPAPSDMVRFDEEKCIGCNACLEVCRSDLLLPNPEKGKHPIVAYPEECWSCGCCVEHCPTGAIHLNQPMGYMMAWKRKETGEIFRFGMENPPEPYTREAVNSWRTKK